MADVLLLHPHVHRQLRLVCLVHVHEARPVVGILGLEGSVRQSDIPHLGGGACGL